MLIYLALDLWGFLGALYWVRANTYNGWPQRWFVTDERRRYYETGWFISLFVLLPICIVGGPAFWIALVWVHGLRAVVLR